MTLLSRMFRENVRIKLPLTQQQIAQAMQGGKIYSLPKTPRTPILPSILALFTAGLLLAETVALYKVVTRETETSLRLVSAVAVVNQAEQIIAEQAVEIEALNKHLHDRGGL